MKVEIRSIHGHGDASEEYVIIDVTQDCRMDDYMVADTTFEAGGSISNKVRHTYWFEPVDLKSGDIVVLYTGNGTNESEENDDGSTIYHVYWGLRAPVWNDDGDGAILFEMNDWKTTKVADTK